MSLSVPTRLRPLAAALFPAAGATLLHAPLARTEGQVAFPLLLRRYREIEPGVDQPQWINSLVFRGMASLPVRVRPA